MKYQKFWLASNAHQLDITQDKRTYRMLDKQDMLPEIKHGVKVSLDLMILVKPHCKTNLFSHVAKSSHSTPCKILRDIDI
jgi:hypothetical protein